MLYIIIKIQNYSFNHIYYQNNSNYYIIIIIELIQTYLQIPIWIGAEVKTKFQLHMGHWIMMIQRGRTITQLWCLIRSFKILSMMVSQRNTKRLDICLLTLLNTLKAYQLKVKEQMILKRNKNKKERRKRNLRKLLVVLITKN